MPNPCAIISIGVIILLIFSRIGEKAAGAEDGELALGEGAGEGDLNTCGFVHKGDRALFHALKHVHEGKLVVLRQLVVIVGIGDGQGQDACIDEVGRVDTGEALCHHFARSGNCSSHTPKQNLER